MWPWQLKTNSQPFKPTCNNLNLGCANSLVRVNSDEEMGYGNGKNNFGGGKGGWQQQQGWQQGNNWQGNNWQGGKGKTFQVQQAPVHQGSGFGGFINSFLPAPRNDTVIYTEHLTEQEKFLKEMIDEKKEKAAKDVKDKEKAEQVENTKSAITAGFQGILESVVKKDATTSSVATDNDASRSSIGTIARRMGRALTAKDSGP